MHITELHIYSKEMPEYNKFCELGDSCLLLG